MHHILDEISKLATSLRLVKSKPSIFQTQQRNWKVNVRIFFFKIMYQTIPLLSVKDLPYPMSELLIFVYLILTCNRFSCLFVPLTELIVVEDKVRSTSENKKGTLVELPFIDKFFFLRFFFLFDVVLGRVFLVKKGIFRQIKLGKRVSKFAILWFHDANSSEEEPAV